MRSDPGRIGRSDCQIQLLRDRRGSACKRTFFEYSPARSRWIAPGRIGFMSTQRRQGQPTPTTKNCRSSRQAEKACWELRGPKRPLCSMDRAGVATPFARQLRGHAGGQAVQPRTSAEFHLSDGNLLPGSRNDAAAISLQLDCRNFKLVRFLPLDTLRVSLRRPEAAIQAVLRLSPLPIPPGFVRFRLSLP